MSPIRVSTNSQLQGEVKRHISQYPIDLRIKRPLLYRLSYEAMAGTGRRFKDNVTANNHEQWLTFEVSTARLPSDSLHQMFPMFYSL